MAPPYSWHVLPARGWPTSAAEELRFVADLHQQVALGVRGPRRAPRHPRDAQKAAEEVLEHQRVNITAVLNALRCGMSVAELLDQLPGAHPYDLLAGYTVLASRRAAAADAWATLVADPNRLLDQEIATRASLLLPIPVYRALTAISSGGARSVTQAVRRAAQLVRERTAAVDAVEANLAHRGAADPSAVLLGARLHNLGPDAQWDPPLWAAAYYLPRRVTDLSPRRVGDLLNERTSL